MMERSEADYARRVREMMKRKNIKRTDEYLGFLEEQKEIKRYAAEKRMREAEWEIGVIKKMRRGQL